MTEPADALGMIFRRGLLRSDRLAQALGSSPAEVERVLAPYVAAQVLISCRVTREGREVEEYRLCVLGDLSPPKAAQEI